MADHAHDPDGTASTEANRFRVFVSYSRDDLDFADQLVSVLKLCGFAPSIDRHGISGGEAWQQRLGALILEADTIVFVLSPASARSDICAWEVEEAVRLGKRILPVLPRALDGATAPQRLQDLNYIFFYAESRSPGSGFGSGMTNLVTALKTDLGWIREHTRLMERATDWDGGGRLASRLLSGSDITQAKAWAARRPKGAPDPTAIQFDYIRASEQEEAGRANTERQRLADMAAAQEERAKALRSAEDALRDRNRWQRVVTWGSVTAAAVLAVVAGWAVSEKLTADKSQAAEAASNKAAVLSKEEADKKRKEAVNYLYESQITRARGLVEKSEKYIADGNEQVALQLTIEALNINGDAYAQENKYFYIPGATKILAMQLLNRQLIGHTGKINSIAVSRDGKYTVTGSDDKTARIWNDKKNSNEIRAIRHDAAVHGVAITPDGTRVVTCAGAKAYIWETISASTKPLQSLENHTKTITSLAMTPDGSRIVTGSDDKTVRVWDAATGAPLLEIKDGVEGRVISVAVSPDGSRIASSSEHNSVQVWDAKTGAPLLEPLRHEKPVTKVAFTPDGSRVFSGSTDKIARIWDAQTGELLQTIEGHLDSIYSVAVMPDGRLVTGSGGAYDDLYKADFTVRLWDAAGKSQEIGSHFGAVTALAVAADGSQIISASSTDNGHRAWVWNIDPATTGHDYDQAKKTVEHCLRIDERREFILPPAPPDWCITDRKKPYDTPPWQTPGATDHEIAQQYGNYADRAVFNGDFPNALKAAELGLQREPGLTWIEINRAHALMFLRRTEEARDLHKSNANQMLNMGSRKLSWKEATLEDFERFKLLGLSDVLMDEIGEKFRKAAPARN